MQDDEPINQAYLNTKTEDERAQIILDLLDRVADALSDVSTPLKVLVTMRVAASYSIANSVKVEQFTDAAGRIFLDTLDDLKIYADQLKKENAEKEAQS